MKRATQSSKDSYIRQVRLKKGMDKGELAFRAGINHGTIDSLEKGRIRCSELNARRIAEALEMPTEWRKFITHGQYLPIKEDKNV